MLAVNRISRKRQRFPVIAEEQVGHHFLPADDLIGPNNNKGIFVVDRIIVLSQAIGVYQLF